MDSVLQKCHSLWRVWKLGCSAVIFAPKFGYNNHLVCVTYVQITLSWAPAWFMYETHWIGFIGARKRTSLPWWVRDLLVCTSCYVYDYTFRVMHLSSSIFHSLICFILIQPFCRVQGSHPIKRLGEQACCLRVGCKSSYQMWWPGTLNFKVLTCFT